MKKMEETMRVENPLGVKPIGKLLREFAIPSIVAMMVSSLYNIVDQIFIGRGVGYVGNAATNVAFPFTTICLAIALAVGIGSATRYSLYLGKKEEVEAAKVIGSGVSLMFFAGILYAIILEVFLNPLLIAFGATGSTFEYAVTYVRITAVGMPLLIVTNGMSNLARADGSPKYSMTSMLIGAVVNTMLDPLFIFGFHMGMAGAAYATVIGQFLSMIYALCYLKKFQRVTVKKEYFRLSFKESRITCTMGLSSGLTQIAFAVLQVILNTSLIYYGSLTIYGSDIPLAASGIVMKVNGLLMAVLIGLNQGMQPIIGYNYGAKKYDRVRQVYLLGIKIALCVGVLAWLAFQLIPGVIIGFFGSGEELYMEYAVRFMRIFLAANFLAGVQVLSANFFSAIGKPIRGAILSLTRQIIILIPLILILPIFMGMDGILIAAPIADVTSCILVVVQIVIEMKKMMAEYHSLNQENKGV